MSMHERIVYRDRDGGERVEYPNDPPRSYTTVKRYQVPDVARKVFEPQEEEDNKLVIRRREPSPARTNYAPARSYAPSHAPSRSRRGDNIDIDIDINERDSRRRDIPFRHVEQHGSDYDRRSEPRSNYRVVDREVIRREPSPEPERYNEWRFERERDFSPPRHEHRRHYDYDVERYSKDTEYYTQPQPQPIIIRESAPQQQAPIIIREERRDPAPIIIRERDDTKDESRSLVKREEPPAPAPVPPPEPEENYFYERRIRELDRPRRRSDSYERSVRPRDSASQWSDDSYEYVRRERIYDEGGSRSRSRFSSRSRSPHHKRHLAEGALAGLGAAEILGHHRRERGEGGNRVGRDVAGAALGAAQKLGGLAAVAGVAALAGYAIKNRNKKNETIIVNEGRPRRSRSRRRRASVDSYMSPSEEGSKAHSPEHKNRRIAQAGLASAAAAGIWEKVRSRSRGGRARSKSRIRQGAPIAAAGLGGAALAGLYEKNKANQESKKAAIIEDEKGRAYGHDPIYPESAREYYSDEEPGMYRRRHGRASSGGSSPDTRRRSGSRRSRSRSRAKDLAGAGAAAGVAGVAAHEYGKRKERSRNREAESRRREDERYEDRYRGDGDHYEPPYDHPGYLPPQAHAPYDNHQAYPGGNYFPPPPTDDHVYDQAAPPQQPNPYPAYNPADYVQGGPQHQPYPHSYGAYDSEANLGAPYPGGNDTFAGDTRYAPTPEHDGRRGRNPDDVSRAPTANTTAKAKPPSPSESEATERGKPQDADGVETPPRPPPPPQQQQQQQQRERSQSRVRFNLDNNTEHSPETRRKNHNSDMQKEGYQDSSGTRRTKKKRSRRRERDDHYETDGETNERSRRRPSSSSKSKKDKHEREERDDDVSSSDGTVELPPRFDIHGDRLHDDDPLANTLNKFLGQAGFADFLNHLGGGNDENDDRRGRGEGGARHRHRH
ncbi:hypothetical protein KC340_g14938 [Hortaea werneckii]|nr:hypothetical protein KC342_g15273 [Hortaea werneckii]KAI7064170.1 hypothetical protein KC339_g16137 [Hortaea werneckii]KAI7214857.1 hypothetical protein KC365_g13783 [Hortaea werneckii]KAI7297421.1 hypothetical protein KC340_g14938 [Hortaea werneckii]KAI7378192.1 hypothetical protein KC328_g14012 [Hortaea werneckii]